MVSGKLTLTLTTLSLLLSSVKWEKHLPDSIIMGINKIMHLKFGGQCMSHGKHSIHIC